MKRKGINSDILKLQSPVQTRKLLLMAAINMLFAIHGLRINIIYVIGTKWSTPTSMAENIASLQIVFANARSSMPADYVTSETRFAIITPLLAFYHFAWFGLGAEARKAYVEPLLKLGRPIRATLRAHWPHLSTPTVSGSATAPLRATFLQGLANVLSLVLPNAPHITPYTSSVPPESPELPTSHVRITPSYSAANRVDIHDRERCHRGDLRVGFLFTSHPSQLYIQQTRSRQYWMCLYVDYLTINHHLYPWILQMPL
jgi:hypothetical protein